MSISFVLYFFVYQKSFIGTISYRLGFGLTFTFLGLNGFGRITEILSD